MFMGVSVKNKYTKEEREKMVIEKPIPRNKNKLSEYLSQPNIKAFNSICTDRMITKMRSLTTKGRPSVFASREECQNEIEGYFKLCYDYDVIPTVASFCVYCGTVKETVYDNINNPTSNFSDLLKFAIATILSYQEGGVMSSEVPAVPFIFLGKQYYGFKDTQEISLSATQNTNNPANTISAIKEQLSAEQPNVQLLDTSQKQ